MLSRFQFIKKLHFMYVKLFILLAIIVLLFTFIGLMTTVKSSPKLSSSIFTTWTGQVDQSIFTILYSVENNTFSLLHQQKEESFPLSKMLFDFITNVRLNDLQSLIGQELPGYATYNRNVIIAGEGMNDIHFLSHESGPPLEEILADRKAIDKEDEQIEDKIDTGNRKVVFLYQSHNRESFLPHLPDETNPDRAYHKEVNITKVSKRMAKSLESYGIGVNVDETDFTNILHEKGWTYGKSYQASRPIVETAIKQNNDLQYIFDIHRDSLPRNKTTKDIDGKSYARPLFVIGAENKNYEKNLSLATKLHYLMDEKYPGLSKGVITKEGPNSNGIYNQDLLENALLLEIGGYDNSLEEMYRTADIIAEIFSEFYWDAEKVSK